MSRPRLVFWLHTSVPLLQGRLQPSLDKEHVRQEVFRGAAEVSVLHFQRFRDSTCPQGVFDSLGCVGSPDLVADTPLKISSLR